LKNDLDQYKTVIFLIQVIYPVLGLKTAYVIIPGKNTIQDSVLWKTLSNSHYQEVIMGKKSNRYDRFFSGWANSPL
jgi:hypothetical protein